MRGGTAHCHVVISDKTIGSTSVSRPGTGIIFNIPSWDKYESRVAPGGLLVVNSSLIPDAHTDRTDVTVLNVPAADLADELGNLRLSNVIMMGATLAAQPVVTVADMRESLSNHIPAHRRGMLDINYKALEMGAKYALKNLVGA
jgi:2-oxoglutarate ferredoxin oxidoreductase subunit gamma